MAPAIKKQRASRLGAWTAPQRSITVHPRAEHGFTTEPKLKRLVEALGLNTTADMLNVDRSQLSRLTRGKETISSEIVRRISDLEYILDRATHVLHPEEIGPWLTSPNRLLGERVPLNVLTREGPGPLISALDGLYAGVLV